MDGAFYGLNGWGIYGLNGWSIHDLNGWGIYGSNGWGGQLLFLGDMLKINTGLQGSTLSGPHMTTGFGPFELPTRGLLQKGRDHSPPKVCLRSPAFGWHIVLWALTVL